MKNKVLIFDSLSSGHHPEFIRHILDYVLVLSIESEFIFCLEINIRKIIDMTLYKEIDFFFYDFITLNKNEKNQFSRSNNDWGVLKNVFKTYPIEHMIFMNLDPYQFIIGTKEFRRYNIGVSGILFHPYYRLGSKNKLFLFDRIYYKKLRKQVQLFWTLRNKKIKNIFILNDHKTVSKLNGNWFLKSVFSFLPDPIDMSISDSNSEIDDFRMSYSKIKLLVFGSLNYRKNVVNIINAVGLLDPSKYQLLIIGKSVGEYEIDIQKALIENSIIDFIRFNDYCSVNMREDLFKKCEIVLLPYIDFYGSSGVLNHSIKHSKPVLCSNLGLISDIVNDYSLGISVEPSFEEIAKGISNLNKYSIKDFSRYISEHRAIDFSKILLQHG